MPQRTLVLAGGNALGCYHAGAYQALHEAEEFPDWIVGSSIGAITAALIAGNPPERRLERLRSFWAAATAPDWFPWLAGARWAAALQTRLLGRPALFHPHLSLSRRPENSGIYEVGPLRRRLPTLIDFSRLNGGPTRVAVLAVDLQSGEEVVFDTAQAPLTVDHLLASAALIPDFPPVRIDNRWLVDGGMAANTPVDIALAADLPEDRICYLVDLFPRDAPVPTDVAGMAMRQSDLIFACQTERTLRAMAALDQRGPPERPRIDVVRTSYAANGDESAMKSWDFSDRSVQRRWQAGLADMNVALQRFRAQSSVTRGLHIHPIIRAEPAA